MNRIFNLGGRVYMHRKKIAFLLCLQLVLLTWATSVGGDSNADEDPLQELMLMVGMQDDLKSKNYLAIPDVWTANVLDPIYDGVGREDRMTGDSIPYLLKGIDADDSGVFDLDEFGVYKKESNPPEVTAYYDFNGVYSHDGVQMTMHDLLFSYHLSALNPLATSLDVLKDMCGEAGSNYTTIRWLNLWPVTDIWDPAIPQGSNTTLSFAIHFSQQCPYVNFARYTLSGPTLMPRHIWEGTGKLCLLAAGGTCQQWRTGLHNDFGYAYDENTNNGVPAVNPNSFDFNAAAFWMPADDEVIGTGPFRFIDWNPDVYSTLHRFEDYKTDTLDCVRTGSPPVCQGSFYSYMHKPYIDGMVFKIYLTGQALVFALQAGEIDLIAGSVPPEFIGDLLADPNIGISASAERGFFYLGYNMRSTPLGYPNNDPSLGDDGFYLRKAIAHVIDKKTIVIEWLKNFGVAADQPVSPSFVRWYNSSVTKYEHNLTLAWEMLDDHYTVGGFSLGYAPSGYRNLPAIGDKAIEIICPTYAYDPIRAASCDMIAENMTAVALNATANHLPFGTLTSRLDSRNMEMWILGWRISSEPPDYYHDFFHSDNAPAGLNYPGFQNATFDALITDAMNEFDLDRQAQLIKECSGLLTDALPYDVLYFRTNIEAYRQDRFVNWTVGPAGSIFGDSFWSWIGIHPPLFLSVDIDFPEGNSVNESETLLFEVSVTDDMGDPVDNASVTISCTPGGPVISPDSGLTVSGSLGPISFEAPEVFGSNKQFTISAEASKWASTSSDSDLILVLNYHPPTVSAAYLSGAGNENVTIDWTLSKDDGSGDMSITDYEILMSPDYDSFGAGYIVVDTVPSGTSSYVDASVGQGDPFNYFYIVCAVDTGSNSSCSDQQAAKVTRTLQEGPNLVSIPLAQADESGEVVLQTVEYDNAWTYDTQAAEWRSFGRQKTYEGDLLQLNHTQGIWINVTAPSSLTVAGLVPSTTVIQLRSGWNLVGFPSWNTTYTVLDLVMDTGATRVEGFHPSAVPHHLVVLIETSVVLAGWGYWVRVESDTSWVIEFS